MFAWGFIFYNSVHVIGNNWIHPIRKRQQVRISKLPAINRFKTNEHNSLHRNIHRFFSQRYIYDPDDLHNRPQQSNRHNKATKGGLYRKTRQINASKRNRVNIIFYSG